MRRMADNYSRLHEIAKEAEIAPELALEQLREARPTRPNKLKSEMLSLRVPEETMRAIEELAAQRDLPVSAMVRGWILQGLAAESGASVPDTVRRLAAEVERLRTLIGG